MRPLARCGAALIGLPLAQSEGAFDPRFEREEVVYQPSDGQGTGMNCNFRIIRLAIFAAAALGSGVASNGAAASGLPPELQRIAEMDAAGRSASAGMCGQLADAIEFIGTDHFRVRFGRCSVDVRLAAAPRPMPPSGRPMVATAAPPRCQ
jgi:hypothetical protein